MHENKLIFLKKIKIGAKEIHQITVLIQTLPKPLNQLNLLKILLLIGEEIDIDNLNH